MNKITTKTIRDMKGKEKITALTCYSYYNARIFNEAGIEILLVGDSLGNVLLGYDNTIPVTLDDMIYHSRFVSRGNTNSLLVVDMPFMSYQADDADAIRNAGRLIKEGAAGAVKLEGGLEVLSRVKSIVSMGIPVMGHLGLKPQSILNDGTYRIYGKNEKEANKLIQDAKALEAEGVFALVLECIPEELAKKISADIKIPTIGIGSGMYCDGQILVFEDMIGLTFDNKKKFVKVYNDIGKQIKNTALSYKEDVKTEKFPGKENILA